MQQLDLTGWVGPFASKLTTATERDMHRVITEDVRPRCANPHVLAGQYGRDRAGPDPPSDLARRPVRLPPPRGLGQCHPQSHLPLRRPGTDHRGCAGRGLRLRPLRRPGTVPGVQRVEIMGSEGCGLPHQPVTCGPNEPKK